MENKRKPVLCDNLTCTGCSACYNACPVKAITMQSHSVEGFYRPVIDDEICIKCLKCEKACPVISPIPSHEESNEIFAAWNISPEIRNDSSSGGAFSALAQAVLDSGGVIIGASYSDNLNLSHIIIDNDRDLGKLRQSKYFQSKIGSVFKEAKEIAKSGRTVLFCGTPCQVAGFKGFLGRKKPENIILVDFICHGVPSPLFFEKYVNWLSEKYGAVESLRFRDKMHGWYDALRVLCSGSGKHVLKGKYDSYWIGFNNNYCLQEACYDCKFLGKNRNSDITIGDFWGIGKRSPFGHKDEIENGVSLMILSTTEGKELFESASRYLKTFRRSIEEVIVGNHAMIAPSKRPTSRSGFYEDLEVMPFGEFIEIHLKTDVRTKMIKIFREYSPKFLIEFIRTRTQK